MGWGPVGDDSPWVVATPAVGRNWAGGKFAAIGGPLGQRMDLALRNSAPRALRISKTTYNENRLGSVDPDESWQCRALD
ncbi:MAG: hypothetical protein Fur0042_07890 [Cyanophyceae cyanobacterium]